MMLRLGDALDEIRDVRNIAQMIIDPNGRTVAAATTTT